MYACTLTATINDFLWAWPIIFLLLLLTAKSNVFVSYCVKKVAKFPFRQFNWWLIHQFRAMAFLCSSHCNIFHSCFVEQFIPLKKSQLNFIRQGVSILSGAVVCLIKQAKFSRFPKTSKDISKFLNTFELIVLGAVRSPIASHARHLQTIVTCPGPPALLRWYGSLPSYRMHGRHLSVYLYIFLNSVWHFPSSATFCCKPANLRSIHA